MSLRWVFYKPQHCLQFGITWLVQQINFANLMDVCLATPEGLATCRSHCTHKDHILVRRLVKCEVVGSETVYKLHSHEPL